MSPGDLNDPYLRFAFWTGTGALLLTLALAAQILLLRVQLRRRQRRQQRLVAEWRPLMALAATDIDLPPLPPIAASEELVFLQLWVHLQASMRGSAREGLNKLAIQAGALDMARRHLARGRRPGILVASLALGYLRDIGSWQPLLQLARERHTAASLVAAWSLVKIRPWRATRALVHLAIGRPDWPLTKIVAILQEAGQDASAVFTEQLGTLHEEALLRALRIAEGLRVHLAPELHLRLLQHPQTNVLAAALRLPPSPAVVTRIRALARHPDWQVRVQAAKALGHVADETDLTLLQLLLTDTQWWVRYRAAQALAGLPFLSAEQVRAAVAGVGDRFATDMLSHVLAEKGLA